MNFGILCRLAVVAPNFASLTCWSIEKRPRDQEMLPTRGAFPQLVEVNLLNAAMGPNALAALLPACPNLRSFAFTAGLSKGQMPEEQFTPGNAVSALVAHAPGLTSLRLDMDGLRSKGRPYRDRIHSLPALTNLEHLTLDLRCWLTDPLLAHWPPEAHYPPDDMALVHLLPASIRSVSLQTGTLFCLTTVRVRRMKPQFAPLGRLLLDLALEAPFRFPRPESLKVGHFNLKAGENRVLLLVFKAVGIKARIW